MTYDFKKPYNRKEFSDFLKIDLLPDDYKEALNEPPLDYSADRITKVIKLGESPILGIKVYEAEHGSENDPRVSLSRESFRLLAKYGENRALIIFYTKSSQNYRFSLITIEADWQTGKKAKKEYSNPRRYSFYLGPDAKTHTPNEYLIKRGKVKDIADLIDRFNVELVTKEFFQKYKELYEKLSKHLQNDRAFSIFAGKNCVDLDTFAKKLLGQIVFLYFIQRKGWLGAAKGAPISSGDKNFVRSLFNRAKNEGGHFFNDYLEYLFYDALNNKPGKSGSFYRDYFECQIPFLNGGLFEPIENYNWQKGVLNIPNSIFSNNQENGVLDVFDLFNFTVYEDDPIDKEVSIDPEMLGKVFENLLPENLKKGKGAYYTPREIVHYMCQESLINYLAQKSEIKAEEIRDHIKKSKISTGGTAGIPFNITNKAIILDNLLAKIKVVDPAVGSGAFLVGMLHEIVNFRVGLNPVINKNSSEYVLKKHTIINSLYGVDIDPGAVEIAKLRLWLSLVVDYELDDIDPLPNLDFKIMQGNSLIELSSHNSLAITGDVKRDKLINEYNLQKNEYANLSDSIQKKGLREHINELLRLIVDYDNLKSDNWIQTINKYSQGQLFERPGAGVSLLNMNNKESRALSKKLKEFETIQKTSPLSHFEWHINFNEVFEKGGFDIAIANPPYIGEKGNEDIFHAVAKTPLGKQYYSRWMDYFYYFIHKSISMIKPQGIAALITTNYYLTATGAIKLRKHLKTSTSLIKLINFHELNIFKSAKGQHNMITIMAVPQTPEAFSYNCVTRRKGEATDSVLNAIFRWNDPETDYYTVRQNNLFEGDDFQIRLSGCGENINNPIESILNKIRKYPYTLKDACSIIMGLVSRADKVSNYHFKIDNALKAKKGEGIFVLTKEELNNLQLSANDTKKYVRPYYKNSDIKQYYCSLKNKLWLLYMKDQGAPIILTGRLKEHFNIYARLLTRLKENFLKNKIAAVFVKRWLANGNYFVLFNPKQEMYFTQPKIVAPYRNRKNTFAYNEIPWYASQDVCYILQKDKGLNLKYILAILNSRLIYVWLYNKGKKKGEMLELMQRPLSSIPIIKIDTNAQKPLISLVDKILNITSSANYPKDTTKQDKVRGLKTEIDNLVYKLYGLTKEEIFIVDGFREKNGISIK